MTNQTTAENIGKSYLELFNSFTQSIKEYDKQIDALVEQELGFAEKKEDYYITLRNARVNSEKRIKEVAISMIERLVWRAQSMFAPVGASLKIDKTEVMDACGYGEYDHRRRISAEIDWMEFSPAKVWDYLVDNYGGNKGEEEGHRQTAKSIVDLFRLRPDTPIRTAAGGRMILERSIYIDSFDKKWSKKNIISYGCSEDIGKSIIALRGFAAWANHDALTSSLSLAHQQLGDYRREIISRAVYAGNGIRIITYLNRFEYQIDPNVAEQLQLFLSLYAFEDLQEAA